MPRLSDATDVRLGVAPVAAVYARGVKVWPTGAPAPTYLWTFDEAAEWTAEHGGGPNLPIWAPGGWTLPQVVGATPLGLIRSPSLSDIKGTGPYRIRVEATCTAWDESIIRPVLVVRQYLDDEDGPVRTTFTGGIGEHRSITVDVPLVTTLVPLIEVEAAHDVAAGFTFYIDEVEVSPI